MCQVLSYHSAFLARSETPRLANSKATVTVRIRMGIYDQVSFYIHLAQLYCYKQMMVIRWAGCLKCCWNVSAVFLLALGSGLSKAKSLQKSSFLRTRSKSCWKQELLHWACRLITPLFH